MNDVEYEVLHDDQGKPYMQPELFDLVDQAIIVCANRVARAFRGYTTWDDIRQTLRAWALKAPVKITRWANDNDERGFHRVLGAVLHDEATYHGRRARAAKLGYTLGDEFYYTKGMLKELLPSVYDHSKWVNPPTRYSESRSGGAPSEGFNWPATLADVSRALSKIDREDRNILEAVHRLDVSFRDLAQAQGVSLVHMHRRYDQALRQLWLRLGGPKWVAPIEDRMTDEESAGMWPAGRRAMSNAQARALTDSQES